MKIRNGFVSNSSSSSFMVFNPPTITNMSELTAYLTQEPNAETRRDFDHMLALFQTTKKYTKKEIIDSIARSIEDGNIPFFNKLFKEKFDEEYDSSITQFIFHSYCNQQEDYDMKRDMLSNEIVKNFVLYMWMFGQGILLEVCNETISFQTNEEERKQACIKWDRKYKSLAKIYNILAENIYEKLKEEKLLESLIMFEVGDDSYPEIEQGYYFEHLDNIVRISNH